MTLPKDLVERIRQEQIRITDIAEHLEGYFICCLVDDPATARTDREAKRLQEGLDKVHMLYSDEELESWEQEINDLFESIGMIGDTLSLLET